MKENENIVAAVSVIGAPGDSVIVSCEENPIAIKIRDALLAEPKLGGADLQIDIQGKQAVISGSIRTEDQGTLALNIAGRYVGRDRVVDQLEMKEDEGVDVCEA